MVSTFSADTTTDTGGPGDCPLVVRRSSMAQRWRDLTFLHWAYDPEVVQRLLPAGLGVETFEGRAWVGLVPFAMDVGLPGVGVVPWAGRFAETNVRTYVRAADGTTGIWFVSLDAARLGAVAVARAAWGLPYFWSSMSVARTGPVVAYECRRRFGGTAARSSVAVEVGEPYAPGEPGDLDHWLTARWRLYRAGRRGIHVTEAEHGPWPLRRARALHVDDRLIAAAGLPCPTGPPVVHWAPEVDVRIGFPRLLEAGAPTSEDAERP